MTDFMEMRERAERFSAKAVEAVASSIQAHALLDERIDGRISEKEFDERLAAMIEAAEEALLKIDERKPA